MVAFLSQTVLALSIRRTFRIFVKIGSQVL